MKFSCASAVLIVIRFSSALRLSVLIVFMCRLSCFVRLGVDGVVWLLLVSGTVLLGMLRANFRLSVVVVSLVVVMRLMSVFLVIVSCCFCFDRCLLDVFCARAFV